MRSSRAFSEAFLDGFTMAGLRKLRSPALTESLFAPEEPALRTVSFQVSEKDMTEVHVQGDLHGLPSGALNSIMRAIAAEQSSRKMEDAMAHGSSN